MAHIKGKGGKSGTRKHGRDKAGCERYRREGRREKNKARRKARKAREARRQERFNAKKGNDQKGS